MVKIKGKVKMPMSNVIRVVKNCNYTTLSNYHFKDKRHSWKAKGRLSTMLSLPDNWNYTIEGLAGLSDDGVKATNSGLAEHAAAPLSPPPVDYLPAALLLTFHKSYIPSLQNALCRPGAAF